MTTSAAQFTRVSQPDIAKMPEFKVWGLLSICYVFLNTVDLFVIIDKTDTVELIKSLWFKVVQLSVYYDYVLC